jgi:hypothetical protein
VNLRSPALSTSAKLFLTAWIVYSAHFATDIVREHYPAFALGERGTLSVDHYLGLHPDLFAIEGRGVFINNNPGASLVGAIPYALFRPAIDIAVERVVAGREGKPPPEFNDPRPNRRAFFEKTYSKGLGIAIGCGLLCDYAGAGPVIVMGIYALARLASVLPPGAAVLRMAPMIAGACIPIGALLAYQAWAFGHPLFPAQQYMPATQYSGEGWNGFDWPALDLLFQNLFDRRFGLFAFGPILLAALAHPFIVGRETARVKRPELWLGFGLFAALLLFTSANQFARLQWNTGFRMLAALIPPLFIVCADVLTRLPHRFLVPLGVVAIFHSWCIAMIRADAWESLTAVLSSGPKLPWLTSIWRAGGTYLPFEASASLLALPFLVLSALGVVATWTRADAPHSPAAHSD